MVLSEVRAEARRSLTGKWWRGIAINIVLGITTFLLSFLQLIPVVGAIAVTVITIPLSFGLLSTFIKLRREGIADYANIFKFAFANFGRAWLVSLHTILKMLPWVIFFVVSTFVFAFGITAGVLGNQLLMIAGIVLYLVSTVLLATKGLYYILANYVAIDQPELSPKQAVEQSKGLMDGYRWKYCCLMLSFLGWVFLSFFTLGIGMLFVSVYMQVAIIVFYEELANKKDPGAPRTSTPVAEEEPVPTPVEEPVNPIVDPLAPQEDNNPIQGE